MGYTEIKCKNCRYWKQFGSYPERGECRRYPTFLERQDDEWCGEFTLPVPIRIHPPEDEH